MRHALASPSFRRLFLAQVLSLAGTGLMTVALALAAYDLAGGHAGQVIGTLLACKMVAYVFFSPLAAAWARRVQVKRLLVGLDLARLLPLAMLPLASAPWHLYLAVFALQLCSAAFTPAFQALVPVVLDDERDYTEALSLSRLAYDLESLLSPLLAGALLLVVDSSVLFAGTALGFVASALLVASTRLPARPPHAPAGATEAFSQRLRAGFALYARTPRLRALFALGLAVSASGSWVLVNSVVYARAALGGGSAMYPMLLAAYGGGSMLVALLLPRALARVTPRQSMLLGGLALGCVPMSLAILDAGVYTALCQWAAMGASASLVLTPAALLLRRSAHPDQRPALFAAHFSLSHAGWLLAYPLSGWLGVQVGLVPAFVVMATVSLLAALAAWRLWPRDDASERFHVHPPLSHAHLHVHDTHHYHDHEGWEGPEPHSHPHRHAGVAHRHPYVIDEHHPRWTI